MTTSWYPPSWHREPRQLLTLWRAQRFASITSEGTIVEMEAKLRRPDVGGTYDVTVEDLQWVEALLSTQIEVVIVPPRAMVSVAGDPEEDYVRHNCDWKVHCLVTGDKKRQQMGTYQQVEIVSP